MDQDKSDTIGFPDLYLGSSTDQDKSDTIVLPDPYLGSTWIKISQIQQG